MEKNIKTILDLIIEIWPKHKKYIDNNFSSRSDELMETSEIIADFIIKIAGENLPTFCEDYQWTCEQLLEEELHFRRTGKYRLNSLQDAIDQVYSNDAYMDRYLNGLLLSQLLWTNHTQSIDFYRRVYLPSLPDGSSHVEIGPGHGLLLYLATLAPNIKSQAGWDISQTALDQTNHALSIVGVTGVVMEIQNAMDIDSDQKYDSIVMSEILEHLEDPHKALKNVKACLNEGGKLYVNVPVNSPAPDHIYLLETPEESRGLLEDSGYTVLETANYPTSQYSLEKATKNKLTISCGLIATPNN